MENDKLNLDFEHLDRKSGNPSGWIINYSEYTDIKIDSRISKSGSKSISIENVKTDESGVTSSSIVFALENVDIKENIELTGYIKTKDVKTEYSGLYISNYGMKEFIILRDQKLLGNNDWQKFKIELSPKSHSQNWYVGAILLDEGKIWVDNLSIKVDGRIITQISKQQFTANRGELDWLRSNCDPIKIFEPGSGFEDLHFLKEAIGNSRIVALGENTHGTSEVFKMKHRIIEYLVKEMDFTIFAIEANMPESYLVNDYVLDGIGDPHTQLENLLFWTWNTSEVLDLINWMKDFNDGKNAELKFTGFDMQFTEEAINNLYEYANVHDLKLVTLLDSLQSLIKSDNGKKSKTSEDWIALNSLSQSILDYFEVKRNETYSDSSKHYEDEWLYQNSRILYQALNMKKLKNHLYRDSCMARNVEWIMNNNPEAKIILWAHNYHISEEKGQMGGYLSDEFSDYYSIGFVSNSGTYTTGAVSDNILAEGQPGSFEYSFHKLDIPLFYFDFSRINEEETNSKWLSQTLKNRNIGATPSDLYLSQNLSKLYNAIIYIDSTSASDCFFGKN